MDIGQFLNNVAAGNANDAKENINDILSAKAFEALDAQKEELAKTMFNHNEQELENTNEVETESDTEQ
jgi:restriction endonuclease S subunit